MHWGPEVFPEQKCQPISHPVGCEILCGLRNLQLRSKFHSRGKGQRYLLCFWLSIQVASEREEGGRWLNAAWSIGYLVPRLEVSRWRHLQKAESCGHFWNFLSCPDFFVWWLLPVLIKQQQLGVLERTGSCSLALSWKEQFKVQSGISSVGRERHCLKDNVGTRLNMGCLFKLGNRGRIVNSGRAVFWRLFFRHSMYWGEVLKVLWWHVTVLGWLGRPAEGWGSAWYGVKCSLKSERSGRYCCLGCRAELVPCLAAALPHMLLEPDDPGNFSLHMSLYIYIYTHTFIRFPLELSLLFEEIRCSLKSLVPQLS